ncbi:unnamed protein product [Ixodes hexagonus]
MSLSTACCSKSGALWLSCLEPHFLSRVISLPLMMRRLPGVFQGSLRYARHDGCTWKICPLRSLCGNLFRTWWRLWMVALHLDGFGLQLRSVGAGYAIKNGKGCRR